MTICSFFLTWILTICTFSKLTQTAPSPNINCNLLCANSGLSPSVSGCACSELKTRSKRATSDLGLWHDNLLPEVDSLYALKRSAENEDEGEMEPRFKSVFRWGKRALQDEDAAMNTVFRWGKRSDDPTGAYGSVFRWGKRSPSFNHDSVGGTDYRDDLDSVDGTTFKRIFRWGKRSYGDASDIDPHQASVFRWGKRGSDGLGSVFRWGKRSNEIGSPPVFRWGKRDDDVDDDDLESNIRSILQWQEKRLQDQVQPKTRSDYSSVFRWGKRSDMHDNRPPLFRWGKRDDPAEEKASPISDLEEQVR